MTNSKTILGVVGIIVLAVTILAGGPARIGGYIGELQASIVEMLPYSIRLKLVRGDVAAAKAEATKVAAELAELDQKIDSTQSERAGREIRVLDDKQMLSKLLKLLKDSEGGQVEVGTKTFTATQLNSDAEKILERRATDLAAIAAIDSRLTKLWSNRRRLEVIFGEWAARVEKLTGAVDEIEQLIAEIRFSERLHGYKSPAGGDLVAAEHAADTLRGDLRGAAAALRIDSEANLPVVDAIELSEQPDLIERLKAVVGVQE